jgi:glucose/arabinose dehydrogenase
MTSLASLPLRHPLLLALLAALALGCGDDDSDGPGLGGSGGGGSGGAAAGGAGAAGTGGGGGGGGAPTGVVPDPLKDCGAAANPSVPGLVLTEIASGLQRPIFVTQPAGDARLFVVEKPGRIRIVNGGTLAEQPFLTVAGVSERGGEMGLLGLAFHPEYAENGRFFVYYSTLDGGPHISRIAEYRVSGDDPNVADPASERVLLEVSQPQDNHNGGHLEFGRDGYLFIGLGDGGGGGDNHGTIGNGQDLNTLLGKILRIDVNGTGAGEAGNYAVPSGNAGLEGALPEIWSYGLRNPWRYSFDACTGDMYIGDVGQSALEEVDFEPAGVAGRNYGWRLMEGDECFNPDSGCDAAADNLILPVATYGRGVGQSITGGYVYRGPGIPDLRGTYLYADYQSARFFALRMQDGALAGDPLEITDNINPGGDIDGISSFGQDSVGEMYVVSFGGTVYRIDAE